MEQKKLELMIMFAKLWGIASVDDYENDGTAYKALEAYSAEDLTNLISSWVDEFFEKGTNDYEEFFDSKMNLLISQLSGPKASSLYPVLYGYAGDTAKELREIQEVADFIMEYGLENDITITREGHVFFLDTFGIFINRIVDMDYRDELMRILVPMQQALVNGN